MLLIIYPTGIYLKPPADNADPRFVAWLDRQPVLSSEKQVRFA